ncbi:MAG: pyridoxal phosphate-dependent aminotransferase [Candidatus Omnitrophica bacterium]|nr:pyridoxal phosphate-dependent aminotransferase [Candidatus Omnitrophota bacterium]
MQKFAQRLSLLKASESMAMAQKVKELQKAMDIIDLTFGQPDFDTPEHIKQAAWKAICEGKNGYTASYGVVELRQAIAEFYQQYYRAQYAPLKEVLVCPGAKQGIMYLMQAFLNPGDEVILFEPCWLSYGDMILLNEGVPKFIPAKADLAPDLNRLESSISPKTKMILINNPVNPSGYVFSRKELEYIVALAVKHDLIIVSDEIYDRIVFMDFTSLSQFENVRDRAIVVGGFSKNYAMTGWRIGYILAAEPMIAKIGLIHQHTATCASSQSQYAALAALTGSQDSVSQMSRVYQSRRDLMGAGIGRTPFRLIKPEGTFYAMMDVSSLRAEPEKNSQELLTRYGIASVNGLSYGQSAGAYVRLSLTQGEARLQECLQRLSKN